MYSQILLYAFYVYVAFIMLLWAGSISLDVLNYTYRRNDHLNWDPDSEKKRAFNPRTLVMVPCKGTDLTLRKNLLSLKGQDYKNYDVVAIVDSDKDPALRQIRSIGMRYILADRRFNRCSGKVRNLLTAMTRMHGYDVYVVVDSDVTPNREWLKLMVQPLQSRSVGVSTTYPYFRPVRGFWSKVKMTWNFVGNAMMESKATRFAWGGSMAFRNGLIDSDLIESMRYAVSDDIEITRACKRQGLEICYVNKRIAYVNTKESFASFYEWANRQTALSVWANRKIWYYGIAVYTSDVIVLLSAIILSAMYNILFIVLFVPAAIGIMKTYLRAERKYAAIFLIYLLIDFLYLFNLFKGGRMRTIRWRGRTYDLYGNTH